MPTTPPRCFCGQVSQLVNNEYICVQQRCPFRVRASVRQHSGHARPESGGSAPSSSRGVERRDAEDGEPCLYCKCGNEAVRRTVRKEGANKGKQFFVCAKPQGEQCGYFEWADKVRNLQNKRRGDDVGVGGGKRIRVETKRVEMKRVEMKFRVRFELEEFDRVGFKIRGMDGLGEIVKEFEGIKIVKTEFLGVQKGLVGIEVVEEFEKWLGERGVAVEYGVPRGALTRILQYEEAEKRREEAGDVVTGSLEEILSGEVCESLMEFQWHGVYFALKRGGRCLIGDDMGLGKTLQAIVVARVYAEDWPLLVVCPSSLRLNWKEEILKWLEGDVKGEDVLVVMSGRDIDRPLRKVNICSYDLMRKMPPQFVRRCGFIIADESHYLKSMTAQRSKALTPLLKNAKRALLLSGTPALSRPVELFPQLNAIAPVLFPNYQEYVERYCAAHVGRFGYDVSGASNLDELHTLLRGSVLIRRKKEEVLTQLPEKQRQVLWVETKPKVMKEVSKVFIELEAAKERLRTAVDDAHAQALQNEVRAAQNELYNLTGQAKIASVLEFCKDTAETGCKFIVFAHHTAVIDAIEEFVSAKLKLGLIRIDGNTPQNVRQQLCKTFQEQRLCRVALLSITAAGVGLTLTRASVVIFAELYWNPGSLLQAEDRAHRIGQRDCVLVKYLLARKTMDESMWGTVRRKLTVVGHSLTGAAARMDVTENGAQNPPSRGTIASFFKKSQTQSTHSKHGDSQLDDDIVEVLDGDTQMQQGFTPSQSGNRNTPHDLIGDERSIDLFPTSLEQLEHSLPGRAGAGAGRVSSDVVDLTDTRDGESITQVDLEEAKERQEQIDADMALAQKLQAQFDSEVR